MVQNGEDILKTFADNLPGAAFYFTIDVNGNQTIDFLNAGCESIWGVSQQDIGRNPQLLWDMIYSDDLAAMHESVQASAKDLSVWEARFRITDAEGKTKWLISRGTPQRRENGSTRWLTFLFDVSDQLRTEELFETVSLQLQHVSSSIPDGFALFDNNGALVVCNEIFRSYYGIASTAQLKGVMYEDIITQAVRRRMIPDAIGHETQWIRKTMKNFWEASGKHEERWSDARWLKVLDRPTDDGGRVAFRIEVTDAVNRKIELELAAATDTLTGALNRRGLANFLKNARDHLEADQRIVIFHIDLDKFKSINDGFGHDAGDFVLSETAKRLQRFACQDIKVARVGGDEFVAVQTTTCSDDEIVALADEMRSVIVNPLVFGDRVCQVGTSIGIAIWQSSASLPIEQTLMDADTALLSGKSSGRNQTVLFHKGMRDSALKNANIAMQIREGLNQNAFEAFFQPQIELPTGRIVGFEALARWRGEDGSFAPAASFIDVANETGLITEIESRVLTMAFDTLAELSCALPHQPTLSINLSCAQLGKDTVVENLLDELLARNLSARQVSIEVLESTLLDNRTDNVIRNIQDLVCAGFRIELDDFGTGHTALASLTKYPVDQIKVDRSLVRNIDVDAKKQAIASGLCFVCNKLGIEAIAEGVETEAEVIMLRELGFKLFQGYYFVRPMPAAQLIQWVRKRHAITDPSLERKARKR